MGVCVRLKVSNTLLSGVIDINVKMESLLAFGLADVLYIIVSY